MSEFTFTPAMLAAARLTIAVTTGADPDATVVGTLQNVADWIAAGNQAKGLSVALSTEDDPITAKACEHLPIAARLIPLVKDGEAVKGASLAVRRLNNNNQSVKAPARLVAAWIKAGKSFATWEALAKALDEQAKADRAPEAPEGDTEGDTEGEEGEGDGGMAGAPTLESEAARIGNDIVAAAEALGVSVVDLAAAVIGHVQTLERAAAMAA